MKTVIIGAIINAVVLLAIAIINKVSEFKLERIKRKSEQEKEHENKKRELYSKLASSLNGFMEARYSVDQKKALQNDFYDAYDQVWIWGNDELIKTLGEFLQASLDGKTDSTLKDLHVKIILEMRKDLGMSVERISAVDYKFIKFN
ncbi:hypothetical protein SAMN05421743_105203 [Thalassobacillus cyri]|uniref:Uncharacterized protein n=1 Tax=Thalassobacillus cyri TaxID=571932 RepID=A0A1H4BZ98_9BACI|nr:hypothetical protein [Thalassobacillus cyri]SEA53390.1 hypothetical protein SAMN05421743_105203 [Thalassobacillus cyri]